MEMNDLKNNKLISNIEINKDSSFKGHISYNNKKHVDIKGDLNSGIKIY
jgi:hypothetical protein